MRALKRPELWLEENVYDGKDAIDFTMRIFYPDGSSEYMTMNTYYANGDVLLRGERDWEQSYGNDWHPCIYQGLNRKDSTRATLLERL